MAALLFGALGIIANIIIYQQKSGSSLIACKLISDVLWAIHYFFMHAYTGMCIAIIAIVRELVFLKQSEDNNRKHRFLIIFLLCGAASAAVTWKGPSSILPALASAISIFSFWRGNPDLSRILAFPISGCMLSYGISCGSDMSVINEVLTMVSSVWGIILIRRERKYSQKQDIN
ncbi:MAG: YgjV family protein [Clostridia bacterium]|nr:YgjV family protein [Clostridia bacterium]